uniref:N-acetyltransferase domain-containing protein n=1 Tax=Timema genevievae TaxID=629358 RepID=A0A7R9JQ38_TIMGE|nr:unnamed protein product [Timema genevievae]
MLLIRSKSKIPLDVIRLMGVGGSGQYLHKTERQAKSREAHRKPLGHQAASGSNEDAEWPNEEDVQNPIETAEDGENEVQISLGITVIVLVLYNLHQRSDRVSRRGYFHWKLHICNFIDKNWTDIFGTIIRKKNWVGTVSGTLSHYSPTYFRSGTEELREPGWWKLTRVALPQTIIHQYTKAQLNKKRSAGSHSRSTSRCSSPTSNAAPALNDTSSRELNLKDSWGLKLVQSGSSDTNTRTLAEPSDTLLEHLFFEEEGDDEISDMDVDVERGDALGLKSDQNLPDLEKYLQEGYQPHLDVSVAGEVEIACSESVSMDGSSEAGEEHVPVKQAPLPSLFTRREKKPWPWITDKTKPAETSQERCVPMSEYEELQLLGQLRKVSSMTDVPSHVRRLYRKLCVRKLKREHNMPVFDLDSQFTNQRDQPEREPQEARVLDRFQQACMLTNRYSDPLNKCSFLVRLMGHSEPTCFHSPYTRRLLKPYIRRDEETTPPWLQLMQEVQTKVHKDVPNWHLPPRAPIDYSYVRPEHVPHINILAREFFYPGIDLTECLEYPDFSCVVLYKKLVVGFALMVPDVGYNEAYISFLLTRPQWRRAGIATFMLYHLIQTCMGRDVTLHVSATNPAIILYQKFGFKVEEFVQDFYDKYFPASSKECRHALFLRLNR